jgi:CubicO group peptidase (beta-lactamase class C family)
MLGPAAFGHAGAGGSLGCADPDRGIAFGYVMNQMNGTGMLPDKRRYRIIDALNRSVS